MIEYFTAGIAVHFRSIFNMTLYSAASPWSATYATPLHCNVAYCTAKRQIRSQIDPTRVKRVTRGAHKVSGYQGKIAFIRSFGRG
jgi:hypothetical protein